MSEIKFYNEYLGSFPDATEDRLKLRKLAEEYDERTEAYDKTVCTGPIKRGRIMPKTASEISLIVTHAKSVLDEVSLKAKYAGFSRQELLEEIQNLRHS